MTKQKNWMGLKNWTGLCALLLSLQVNSGEINIQDAWVRPLTPGQDAMAGMVINSDTPALITAVMSPAYQLVTMQGPGKSGANKTQEIGHIALPAKTAVMLGADSMHLLLTGNKHTLAATDKVPLFLTVKFDDNTRKVISILAQPVLGKGAAAAPASSSATVQTSTAMPPTPPVTPVETSTKVEAKAVTPSPQPAPSKAIASPAKPVVVAAPKPPVAEVKPSKAAPVAAPKSAPTPVAASVVAAPLPASPHAPVTAPAAVTVVAPLAVEPKKVPEAKPAEQPKQQEAQASAECVSLAVELRDCSKVNEMMQEWCVTSAKSKYSCKLTMEQLKKL